MFIEKLVLENFKCFGPGGTSIHLDPGMTALVGANGSGKTAACEALLRLFGISGQERTVRVEDFHVPQNEADVPPSRELTIEAVFAFPELDSEGGNGEGGDGEGGDGEGGDGEGGGDTAEGEEQQRQVPRAVPESVVVNRSADR